MNRLYLIGGLLTLLLIAGLYGCGETVAPEPVESVALGDGDGNEPNIILSDGSGCYLDSLNAYLPEGTMIFSLE